MNLFYHRSNIKLFDMEMGDDKIRKSAILFIKLVTFLAKFQENPLVSRHRPQCKATKRSLDNKCTTRRPAKGGRFGTSEIKEL